MLPDTTVPSQPTLTTSGASRSSWRSVGLDLMPTVVGLVVGGPCAADVAVLTIVQEAKEEETIPKTLVAVVMHLADEEEALHQGVVASHKPHNPWIQLMDLDAIQHA